MFGVALTLVHGVEQQCGESPVPLLGGVSVEAGADEFLSAIEELLAVELVAVLAADLVEQDGLASGVAFAELICSCRLRILGPPACLRREQMSLTG